MGTKLNASRWAICSGLIGVCCFLAAGVGVLLAILPAQRIGQPYLRLVETLNPGIDAPDNWAIATTYFFRINASLVLAGMLGILMAVVAARRETHPAGHVSGRIGGGS